MKYIIDHDYHIHTPYSDCSADPGMSTDKLLKFAEEHDYTSLCITDHFWDERIPSRDWSFYSVHPYSKITKNLPLPKSGKVDFRFGCETDVLMEGVIGISPDLIEKFDFVVIPTTHFHFDGYVAPAVMTDEEGGAHWIKMLDMVLDKELPFKKIGIAHLACGLMHPYKRSEDMLKFVTDEEYERVFTKAAKCGVGIEINGDDFDFERYGENRKKEVLRMYKKAKECGCKFYLGSDAHHPPELHKAPEIFANAIELLGLTEDDKFRPFGE